MNVSHKGLNIIPVTIGGYTFSGWFVYVYTLDGEPGLYAIGCKKDDKVQVIDVGETDNIQDRVKKHDRKDCWKKECKTGSLRYAQYTTKVGEDERRKIEKKIRDDEDPPCGKE